MNGYNGDHYLREIGFRHRLDEPVEQPKLRRSWPTADEQDADDRQQLDAERAGGYGAGTLG